MRLSVIVALCTGVALATAYSVTPNVAVGIGGAADEAVMGVAGDAAGSYYAVGWTLSPLLNSSFAAGGPTVTTYYAATYAKTGEAKNGFVTKYSKSGVPQWSAYVGGAADQTVNAVAVSSSQTIVVVCGSYSGSDAYIAYGAGSNQTLSASQRQDVFIAGFSASTGGLLWSFAARSNLDDECLRIAEHNGLVAYGGYAFAGPGTGINRFDPEGRSPSTIRSWNAGSPTAYVGQCATADAAISGRLMTLPTFTHNCFSAGYSGVTRALTFDSVGNLWAATNIEYRTDFRAPFSASEVAGTHDVGVVMFPASAVQDQAYFENYGPNQVNCPTPNALDPSQPVDPACVTYPGTFPYGVAQLSYFGSDGDDIVTGISVQNMPGDVWANLTFTNSRVVLTGYTVGATAGSTFKVHQYIELTDPTAFAENAPASAFDFVLPNSGEVGWWMAQNASFNADGGAAFYAKALPSGLSGRINSVACDATTKHCVAAASLQGSATLTVSGASTAVTSVGGSRDAFVMRVDAAGNIVWLEQSGGVGNDSALAVVLFNGAGLTRSGQWATVGGYFTTGALGAGVAVTPNSASPIVVGGRGGADGLMVSYDDVDDCGLDTSLPLTHPYGNNACGVMSGTTNGLGASQCLDEPGFPLCFCRLNVTSPGAGAAGPPTGSPPFCNARGWNCAFAAQYYIALLDVCSCPAGASVDARVQACAANACQFGALTGDHATCLPLVLDLIATCGTASVTPAPDRAVLAAYKSAHDACAGGSSSAGGCPTGETCAAPRASAPASGVVTALATVGAALLIATTARLSSLS